MGIHRMDGPVAARARGIAAAGLALVLAACGGGGGAPVATEFQESVDAGKLHVAATAAPRFGASVNQSSNVSADNDTTDSVTVAYAAETNAPVVTLNDGERTVSTESDPARRELQTPTGEIYELSIPGTIGDEDAYIRLYLAGKFVEEDWKAAEQELLETLGRAAFEKKFGSFPISADTPDTSRPITWSELPRAVLPAATQEWIPQSFFGGAVGALLVSDVLGDPESEEFSVLTVIGFTESAAAAPPVDPNSPAANPLTWGNWTLTEIGPRGLVVDSIGAFAHAPQVAASVPKKGAAIYRGYASGFGVRGAAGAAKPSADDDVVQFLGSVTLSANFDAALVSGSVHGLREVNRHGTAPGADSVLSGLTISLDAGSIQEGTFAGAARAAAGLEDAAGEWGGQFFGPSAGPRNCRRWGAPGAFRRARGPRTGSCWARSARPAPGWTRARTDRPAPRSRRAPPTRPGGRPLHPGSRAGLVGARRPCDVRSHVRDPPIHARRAAPRRGIRERLGRARSGPAARTAAGAGPGGRRRHLRLARQADRAGARSRLSLRLGPGAVPCDPR